MKCAMFWTCKRTPLPLTACTALLCIPQVVSEVEDEMDPDSIAASLEQRALHIQLHGLNGLKANNMVLVSTQSSGRGMQLLIVDLGVCAWQLDCKTDTGVG